MGFIEHFATIDDPRSHINVRHECPDILFLTVGAVMSGAEGWKDIKQFGDEKLAWLRQYRSLGNGIPVDDTIARVVRAIDPAQFNRAFINWVNEIRREHGQEQVALDGKTLRRSHDGERQPALHSITVPVENSPEVPVENSPPADKIRRALINPRGLALAWPAGFAFGLLYAVQGLALEGIGDQVGVFPQPVGMPLNLDHDGMVQQAVQQRGGHDDVTEDGAPVPEAAIGGKDGGALLVAGIDQLEEQVGAAGFDRQVADLIDDKQGDPVDVAQARGEGTGAFGLGERGDEFGQGREIDALMGLDGGDPQGDGQVTFTDAGQAEQVDGLAAVDEAEFGQGEDTVAVEAGLEAEVEGLQGLDLGEARGQQLRPDAACLASGIFFGEQAVQGFQGGELLAFHLVEYAIEDFQGGGHLQVHQVLFDCLQGADGVHVWVSRALAWPMRW